MKTIKYLLPILLVALYSCSSEDNGTDATGVFEATEIIVSAESSGKLLSFSIQEGDELIKDQPLGQIDSTQLYLNKLQVKANQVALLSSRPDVQSQLDAIEREIEKAEFEKMRIEKLLKGDVATQKQLDDINAQIEVLRANYKAKKTSLNISTQAIDAQGEAMGAQIDLINDQLERSKILSPIDGTVLVKYAEKGELAAMGKPLFKLADLNQMILRAYVTADQLPSIQTGLAVKVLAEFGKDENREYDGKITWISSKSEFTPKTIQTQDERANLVYAVKITVPNDGLLKIGMYGGIKISE
ncbi:MAG: HlyD family efflux transporter periplasmic adaptor subunit [Bacteroidales bacterium]|nr:HlyD family efflux transporter periplasmic adaptor subunit [Bacteroidales bacterium]